MAGRRMGTIWRMGRFSRESFSWVEGRGGVRWLDGGVANLLVCNRMAPIVYTAEGGRLSEALWLETMDELAFARAAEIVQSLAQ